MDLAKDEMVYIRYKEENKKESKFLKFLSNHKFISSLSIIGLAVCVSNGVLIYNFFNILVNM